MTKKIVVLDPAQIKPGLITPGGRTVKAVNMYVNEASGFLVFDLKLDDGKEDVLEEIADAVLLAIDGKASR